ncbi:MAG: hypothetical protein JNL66_06010 [Alphaproteobacteria bacterium]|nr:hypothetical protein [Alphaproteobacteria bacterium]
MASAAAAPARAQDQSSAIERVETPDGTVTIVRPARRPPPPATAPQGPIDPATATVAPGATIDRGTRRQEERRDTLPHAGSAAPDIVIIQQRRGRYAPQQQTPTVDPGMGPVPSLRAYEPPVPQPRRPMPTPRGPDGTIDTIIIRR